MSAAIITFLVLLPAFQMLAFYTYRYEVRWLYTDYVWLVIAASALIFYALKAGQDEAKRVLPAYDNHLSGMAYVAKGEIGFSDFYLSFFSNVRVTNETEAIRQQKVEFTMLNKRLESYRLRMESPSWPYEIERFHNCQELSAGLHTKEALHRVTSICEFFKRVISSRTEREELSKRSSVGGYETLEYYGYPFLLAFALAVRLGRTTADVLRKSRNNRGQATISD